VPDTTRSGRRRILVVEDDDEMRQLLAEALGSEGYVVEEATTAEDGLAQLRRGQYDLVLTDYALPRRTGTWMLQRAVRSGLLSVPAFIVTAHPRPPPLPGVPVITKPFDLDRFLARVRDALSPLNGGS
jgi:two-component system response regulator QseB